MIKQIFIKTIKSPYKGGILKLGGTFYGQGGVFLLKPLCDVGASKITPNDTTKQFIAGGCSGIAQAFFKAPFTTITIKKITLPENTPALAIYRNITKGNNIQRLFTGCGSMAFRNGSYWGTLFSLRNFLIKKGQQLKTGELVEQGQNSKSITRKQTELSEWENALAGTIASMVGATVSTPFDLIAKLQINSNKPNSIYKTAIKVMSKEKGRIPIKAFYRGFPFIAFRMGAAGAAISAVIRLSERIFVEEANK